MMKKIQTILYALSLVCLGGCSDFLKEESQDEVMVRTVKDYGELLLGVGYPNPELEMFGSLYLLDDDIELNESYLEEQEGAPLLSNFATFTWQPDMWERLNKIRESYTFSYEHIMGCNAILDGIDQAIGDDVARERVKAEALALRAYFYFQLVNMYAQPYNVDKLAPGVPLKLTAGIEENGIRRSTVEEVYEQIVSDLQAAAALLEKYPKTRGDFKINYPSVNILLSRAYLFMERWTDATTAATLAIKNSGSLTDYTQIDPDKYFFTDYTNTEVEWIYGAHNRSNGMAGMLPAQDLLSKFAPEDCRLNLYFKTEYDEILVNKQMSNHDYYPYNVLRVSEAYLNRAEAYARTNSTTPALADLNELRRNRISDYENVTSTESLLNDILLERRKELCFEEHRWFDLRRNGMPSISHRSRLKLSDPWKVYTLKEKDPLYTLPIPNDAIVRNGLLEQNASANESLRSGR